MVRTLTVWDGDFGLASINEESLILLTIVRIAKIECKEVYVSNPLTNNIPSLKIEEDNHTTTIIGFENILSHLILKQVIKHCDICAYKYYIAGSLIPALDYMKWVDERNYIEVTRTWYRNAIPFPVNMFYPYLMNKTHDSKISQLLPSVNEDEIDYLIDKAKYCIKDLSIKLGIKEYFLGQPSSLDAVMYGYLAPILMIKLPNRKLYNCLLEQHYLVEFIKNITRIYFPEQKVKFKYLRPKPEEESQDFQASSTSIIMAALVTSTAMISYGLMIGVIKLPFFK